MAKKTSFVWDIDKEYFLEVAQKANSITDILRTFNLHQGTAKAVKKRLIELGVDPQEIMARFAPLRATDAIAKNKHDLDKVMIENSDYSRGALKRRIIKEKIIEYVCADCGNDGSWRNKKLVLVLDHINGIRNDHRKENLRFLCPNCNSQGETFTGKNKSYGTKAKKFNKCLCGTIISRQAKTCCECRTINTRKKNWPTKEELQKLVWEFTVLDIAKRFNVSDPAIHKWIKEYKINKPPRGYWLRSSIVRRTDWDRVEI